MTSLDNFRNWKLAVFTRVFFLDIPRRAFTGSGVYGILG